MLNCACTFATIIDSLEAAFDNLLRSHTVPSFSISCHFSSNIPRFDQK